jgi:hypothetical protein
MHTTEPPEPESDFFVAEMDVEKQTRHELPVDLIQ